MAWRQLPAQAAGAAALQRRCGVDARRLLHAITAHRVPHAAFANSLETTSFLPSTPCLCFCRPEYEPWLARGVAGFQPPSDASRQALEGEASLAIGAKKLPLEAGLRAAAADLSRSLQLDEVQAYVLLRRWVAKAGGGGGGGGASAAQAVITPGAPLSPAQRLEVAQLYFSERLCLLKSIEDLLWEGERECAGVWVRKKGGDARAGRYCVTLAAACHGRVPVPASSLPSRAFLPLASPPTAGAEGGPLLDVIEGTLQVWARGICWPTEKAV